MSRSSVVANITSLFTAVLLLGVIGNCYAQAPAPPTPGPEHQVLHNLVGEWQVGIGDEAAGTAVARLRLGDRFLEVTMEMEAGPISEAIYTFGYDRRNNVYTVLAFDNTGTYWVAAEGVLKNGVIKMYGKDNDPYMKAMGFDKEFLIALQIESDTDLVLETYYIDTRTPARTEMLGLSYSLRR